MRKTLAAVTMVMAVLVGAAAPSDAATGSQRFIIRGGADGESVFAVGLVTGQPDVVPIDENADTYVFSDGSFRVTHPETSSEETFNEVACVGTGTFEGTFTLSHGTGAYAGITGSGTYSGRAIFWTTRTANGCSENEADGGFVFFVNARGTATLP